MKERVVDLSRPENNASALYLLGMLERWRAPSAKDGADSEFTLEQLVNLGHPRPVQNGSVPRFAYEYTFDVQASSYTALEVLRDEQIREARRIIRTRRCN